MKIIEKKRSMVIEFTEDELRELCNAKNNLFFIKQIVERYVPNGTPDWLCGVKYITELRDILKPITKLYEELRDTY